MFRKCYHSWSEFECDVDQKPQCLQIIMLDSRSLDFVLKKNNAKLIDADILTNIILHVTNMNNDITGFT